MQDSVEIKPLPKAFLIACYRQTSEKSLAEEHLEELKELTRTYGAEVVHSVACPLKKIEASTYLGSGKLEELALKAKELSADIIIVDEEISPAQQRNLEAIFKLTVMDRAELILAVFAAAAQTKEARLQVELAHTKYQIPRLKRLWTHLHRQTGSGGSGAYVKGEGEKQIELDRRILNKKIDELEREIKTVVHYRKTQRALREKTNIPIFAIIGYTNAGKSTLMNRLTNAGILAEDKLFATLDTTTRKFLLPNNQDVLMIDTVGFIRKLPHLLVAAFKSTLEESLQADVLLHLIDVSHPFAEAQSQASLDVLRELNALDKPIITVLNKVDLLEDPAKLQFFRTKFIKTVAISAETGEGIEHLIEMMVTELKALRRVVELRIPQKDYGIISQVLAEGQLLHRDYEENDVLLRIEIPELLAEKLKRYITS